MTGRVSRFRLPPAASFLWVFGAAVLLRGVYLWQAWSRNELIAYPVVDEAAYIAWAREILAGHWLWYEPTNYTPGHPLWLAGWIGFFGWHPAIHFGGFLLLGAAQAVLVGKTAELLWNRAVGLLSGWLAALYWPLIIFEASYFSEPLAIFQLVLAVYLVVRWSRTDGAMRFLAWGGFCLGWSVLARANTILCVPVFAAWIVWQASRGFTSGWWKRAGWAALLFCVPVALLIAPVMAWNFKITGHPILRTEGWLSVYVGNEPDFHGRAVQAGVRWTDLIYRPVRAGVTDAATKELYWKNETLRAMKERTGEWWRLMGEKALMLAGRFEVSQEIDIGIFRAASPVLAWPIWPGWGAIFPLALVTLVAMAFSTEARKGGLLALCGLVYLGSIAPVQAAARYRLPAVVLFVPLAAWAAVMLVQALRRRDLRASGGMLVILGLSVLLVVPDWLGLRNLKIVNHWFFLGLKRDADGNPTGAEAAYAKGAEWNPNDPDCLMHLASHAVNRGDLARGKELYQKLLQIFPASHEATIGLGDCELRQGHAEEALRQAQQAMRIAPNNLDALSLASRVFASRGEWRTVAMIYRQMRSYPTHPSSVNFAEARAWILADRPAEAVPLYDLVAKTPWFEPVAQAEGSLLGGVLAWQDSGHVEEAQHRWQSVADEAPGLFQALAAMLVGREDAATLRSSLPKDLPARSQLYVEYACALEARLHGKTEEERRCLETVLSIRQARQMAVGQQDVVEILALRDLARLPTASAQ